MTKINDTNDLVNFICELNSLKIKRNRMTREINDKKRKLNIYGIASTLSCSNVYRLLKELSPENTDKVFRNIIAKDINLSFNYILSCHDNGDIPKVDSAVIDCLMDHPEEIVGIFKDKTLSLSFSTYDIEYRKTILDMFHHEIFPLVSLAFDCFYNYLISFNELISDNELELFIFRIVKNKKVNYAQDLLNNKQLNKRLNDSMKEKLNSLLVISKLGNVDAK